MGRMDLDELLNVDVNIPAVDANDIHKNDENVYPNEKHGAALVVNYQTFKNLNNRYGSEKDEKKAIEIVSQIGYNYEIYMNYSKELINAKTSEKVLELFKKFAKLNDHNDKSSMVIFIMSHGCNEHDTIKGDHFCIESGKKVNVLDVVNIFNQYVKNKKLVISFFFNFCRSKKNEKSQKPESEETSEENVLNFNEMDLVDTVNLKNKFLIYSSLIGYKGNRFRAFGSLFIIAVIRAFNHHAAKKDVVELERKKIQHELQYLIHQLKNKNLKKYKNISQLSAIEYDDDNCKFYFYPKGIRNGNNQNEQDQNDYDQNEIYPDIEYDHVENMAEDESSKSEKKKLEFKKSKGVVFVVDQLDCISSDNFKKLEKNMTELGYEVKKSKTESTHSIDGLVNALDELKEYKDLESLILVLTIHGRGESAYFYKNDTYFSGINYKKLLQYKFTSPEFKFLHEKVKIIFSFSSMRPINNNNVKVTMQPMRSFYESVDPTNIAFNNVTVKRENKQDMSLTIKFLKKTPRFGDEEQISDESAKIITFHSVNKDDLYKSGIYFESLADYFEIMNTDKSSESMFTDVFRNIARKINEKDDELKPSYIKKTSILNFTEDFDFREFNPFEKKRVIDECLPTLMSQKKFKGHDLTITRATHEKLSVT